MKKRQYRGVKSKHDDVLLHIYEAPVFDGNLISKQARDAFVKCGLVVRCEGFNIITDLGKSVVQALGIYNDMVLDVESTELTKEG